MNKEIQPKNHDIVARCACGATYPTRSTKSKIEVTLCGSCHPFYTGKQKFVDAAGRIEQFERKYGKKK